MLSRNLTAEDIEVCCAAYDTHRTVVTANRIPLTHYNWLAIAVNWIRNSLPRYEVSPETALLHLVRTTGRYYFDGRMAQMGTYVHSVALYMCVPLPTYRCCLSAPSWGIAWAL
jgi:hypothetical protein